MRNIRITEEVWLAIASKGKFGESEDDVLRRMFGLPSRGASKQVTPRTRIATNKQSVHIADETLIVEYADGGSRRWKLPAQDDHEAIRRVRDQAWRFADEHEATIGQKQGIVHRMCSCGYFVSERES